MPQPPAAELRRRFAVFSFGRDRATRQHRGSTAHSASHQEISAIHAGWNSPVRSVRACIRERIFPFLIIFCLTWCTYSLSLRLSGAPRAFTAMTCNFLVSGTVAACRCAGIPFAVGDIQQRRERHHRRRHIVCQR